MPKKDSPAKKELSSDSPLPSDLSKLLVKDLKHQLGKRRLSQSGIKAELVSRLKQAIDEEGNNGTVKETESELKVESTKVEVDTEKMQTEENTTPIKGKKKTPTRRKSTEKIPVVPSPKKVEEVLSPQKSEELLSPQKTPEVLPPQKTQAPKNSESQKQNQVLQPESSPSNIKKTIRKRDQKEINQTKLDNMNVEKNEESEPKSSLGSDSNEPSPSGKRRKWITPGNLSILPEFNVELKKDSTPRTIKLNTPKENTENIVPEIRSVPPPKNPESNVLHVKNFVRPLTKIQVEELLKQTGKIVNWGMDPIKSQCFVVYESIEQGILSRQAIHNLMWPSHNTYRLSAEFSTEEDARRFFLKNHIPVAKTGVGSVPSKQEQSEPLPEPEPSKTLEQLFMKTTSMPVLYYLPLSDEEVSKRKEKSFTNSPKKE